LRAKEAGIVYLFSAGMKVFLSWHGLLTMIMTAPEDENLKRRRKREKKRERKGLKEKK